MKSRDHLRSLMKTFAETFLPHQKVVLSWQDGEFNTGTVISATPRSVVIEVDDDPGEEYEFEFNNGSWYEINNSTVPVKIRTRQGVAINRELNNLQDPNY